ncbi:MAG: hypothetical protein MJA27_00675 [Pseudanabaenales cyanobacterium]|nr:hypothetical protein [Pseudanabaenales cyanobacterium]
MLLPLRFEIERLDRLSNVVNVLERTSRETKTQLQQGECRHPTQKIRKGKRSKGPYIDYTVDLPGRSLNEFCLWGYRFRNAAKILTPPELAERHYKAALNVVQSYGG